MHEKMNTNKMRVKRRKTNKTLRTKKCASFSTLKCVQCILSKHEKCSEG